RSIALLVILSVVEGFLSYTAYTQQIVIQKNGNINSIVPVSAEPTSGNMSIKENSVNELPLFNWVLKFTVTGRVFKYISFANPQVGYIVTELGTVYKSTNAGDNWTSVMNLGFPYYWYGVHALTPDTVVIAGFNNQDSIRKGVVRWT